MTTGRARPPNSIADLRQATQKVVEPPTYKVPRILSVYITRVLIPTPATPNLVTLFQAATLLAAGALFTQVRPLPLLIGAVLIFISYILDCVDGELARARGTSSKLGSQLEQIVHWTTSLILLACATAGAARKGGDLQWLVGIAAIAGDATFHFTYYQLNLYATPGKNYGHLHIVTRTLYRLMPIDTNLLILGGLTLHLEWAIIVWAVVSNIAWLAAFILYFRGESRS